MYSIIAAISLAGTLISGFYAVAFHTDISWATLWAGLFGVGLYCLAKANRLKI